MLHPPKKRRQHRLSPRLALILTLGGAALAVALVLLLPQIQRAIPARVASQTVSESAVRNLEIRDSAELSTITVRRADGGYTLAMQEGRLRMLKNGEWTDIDQSHAQDIADAATQIVVQDTVAQDAQEVSEHLADMGLDPPQIVVSITYEDGGEATLELGYEVPLTPYVYYRWSGDPGVYMCDSGILDAFSLTEARLLPVVQPSLQSTLVETLTLEKPQETVTVSYPENAPARLTSPVSYPADVETANALLTALANFRLGTVLDDPQEDYGFDEPLAVVTVSQRSGSVSVVNADGGFSAQEVEAQTLRFVIGRAQGDFYYTCLYEDRGYLVSRFLIQSLVNATSDSLLSRNPADLGDGYPDAIVISTEQGEAAITVTQSEQVLPNNELATDEYGNVLYTVDALCNGETMNQEALDALLERLDTLSVSGSVTADQAAPGPARWRIVLTQGDVTRTLEGVRLNAFADALWVDGQCFHYVHAETIDRITSGLSLVP